MESSNTNSQRQNDIQILIEFNLGSALDNTFGKISKTIDKKIGKLNSAQNNRQAENLNRAR